MGKLSLKGLAIFDGIQLASIDSVKSLKAILVLAVLYGKQVNAILFTLADLVTWIHVMIIWRIYYCNAIKII